ncbi:winged helix DNA-binding domain-containing protein [Streptomyces sp. NPDC049954]|uniref:winged helix DNA-binding domain-containing protein n=1 Tax=Streptomyces sp. NPDC049954 TaxID=3155779 RepID=UPI003426A271
MPATRTIDPAERRSRLALRHRLTPDGRAERPEEVARSLLAVHGTDPSSVYVGLWARMRDGQVADVERALYEDRTLLRLLAMRRTVFVTGREDAPLLLAGCSLGVAAKERRKLLGFLAASGVADTPAGVERWLAGAESAALDALAARGEATAAELAGDDERLATEIVLSAGKSYEGRQKAASRVLLLLAAEGRVVRGRPRGSWTSHQYRWAPVGDWLPEGLPALEPRAAEAALARRWLSVFGPGTAEDLRWWTGWTKTRTTRALAQVDPVEVRVDGGTALLLPEDLGPVERPAPWAALLPALDSTPMGWSGRDWFLGPHGPRLFDRAGNVGPTVWWDGRVVGGWAQDRAGDLVCRFLEDVGHEAEQAVQAEAERLAARLGPVRLTPRTRGRTWLEEELAGE